MMLTMLIAHDHDYGGGDDFLLLLLMYHVALIAKIPKRWDGKANKDITLWLLFIFDPLFCPPDPVTRTLQFGKTSLPATLPSWAFLCKVPATIWRKQSVQIKITHSWPTVTFKWTLQSWFQNFIYHMEKKQCFRQFPFQRTVFWRCTWKLTSTTQGRWSRNMRRE